MTRSMTFMASAARKTALTACALMMVAVPLLAQEARIRGRVTSDGTTPLPALVTIDGTSIQTMAKADGYYDLRMSAPGTYMVTARYIGNETVSGVVVLSGGSTAVRNFSLAPVAVVSHRILSDTVIAPNAVNRSLGGTKDRSNLLPTATQQAPPTESTGRLVGTVRDADGNPLGYASVRLVEDPSHTTVTDSLGGFVLSGVPAGTFTARALLIGFTPATDVVTIVSGQEPRRDFRLIRASLDDVIVSYGPNRVLLIVFGLIVFLVLEFAGSSTVMGLAWRLGLGALTVGLLANYRDLLVYGSSEMLTFLWDVGCWWFVPLAASVAMGRSRGYMALARSFAGAIVAGVVLMLIEAFGDYIYYDINRDLTALVLAIGLWVGVHRQVGAIAGSPQPESRRSSAS